MLKAIFLLFTLVHGLIHFIGYAKAFNNSSTIYLTKMITKPWGVVWLSTAVLFIIMIPACALKKGSWPYIAMIAVAMSQLLIVKNWDDAKYGTIANIVILAVAIMGLVFIKFKSTYKQDVKAGLLLQKNKTMPLLNEIDIKDLPLLIQKYIRLTGGLEKPQVQNFKINLNGKIRSKKESIWMPLETEQYNFIPITSRYFYLDAVMKYMPVKGYHRLKNGISSMDIRLFALYQVQYATGPQMAISETVTFFNDICCMAPAALIDKRIKWLEVYDDKVKASFTQDDITVSAWLYFNQKGELINFISYDRYAEASDGSLIQMKWSTPLRDYKDMHNHRLASYAETIYTYPDGDFTYATFSVIDVQYNVTK